MTAYLRLKFMKIGLLSLILALFSINGLALDKPRFIGVYLENKGKFTPIGWRTKPEQALQISSSDFTVITYGIELNPGGGDILNPKARVGVKKDDSKLFHILNIEPLDVQEYYYRYHFQTQKEIQPGMYFFFIKNRVWGNYDKYYFEIKGKE